MIVIQLRSSFISLFPELVVLLFYSSIPAGCEFNNGRTVQPYSSFVALTRKGVSLT